MLAGCEPSASNGKDLGSQGQHARRCIGPLSGDDDGLRPGSESKVPEALDEALARGALDRESFGLGADRTVSSKLAFDDPRMLEGARAALRRPLALRARGHDAARAFDEALASDRPVTRAIIAASLLREAPVAGCLDPMWLLAPAAEMPLARALAETGLMTTNSASDLRRVPLELQGALVPIVRALAWSASEIEAARSAAGPRAPQLMPAIDSVPGWILGARRFELSDALVDAFEHVDTKRIATAAASVAYVVEEVDLRRFVGMKLEPVVLNTRIGPIVLRGASNDVWDATDAPALLVDTGGDDAYYGPLASSSLRRSISVAIDLGGRDVYAYREVNGAADDRGARLPGDDGGRAEGGRSLSTVGRQGSGVLGVGLLFDFGSDADEYRSLVASQGAGSHGVGVVYDEAGDDRYEAEGFSQGAAAWGIGLLLDRSGADRYFLHNSGQGFGFTRGVGGLIDAAGADVYTADPGEPSLGGTVLYPSDQLPGPPSSPVAANHSFAQGCGAGHRPDWPDPGRPFPGGLGVLRDARGDDRYVAGVFAQACGFVQGVGMLLEGAGDDTYDGLYYVQGAAAHLAASVFADEGGNDRYNAHFPVQGPALGVGHDLSVALHGDAAGDDVYRASWASLGSGIANGIGTFIDEGGRDEFDVGSTLCLGAATTSDVRPERTTMPTIGIFVKANGSGGYTVAGNVVDRSGQTWRATSGDPTIEIGVGVDRPSRNPMR